MARILCLLMLLPFTALAELTKVEVQNTQAFSFQDRPYEAVSGYLHFAFDPQKSANQIITDLELAPVNKQGLVQAKARFYAIQPTDQKVRGTLLEVSNRGSKASLRYFNQAPRDALPASSEALGDGLIQDLGLRMLWVGWQADVHVDPETMHVFLPKAMGVEGWVRSDWTLDETAAALRLAHRSNLADLYPLDPKHRSQAYLTRRDSRNGLKSLVAKTRWRFNEAGTGITGSFEPGIYELVYPSKDPAVIGVGLAILRDTAGYLKSETSQFPSDKVLGFGVSQTGRLLRHFLYQGFNQTETGGKAFDGLLIHTAGAGRGSFNHRFAQPSRDAHPLSAFFYPTDLFPFTSRAQPHPVSGEAQGLLDHQSVETQPKIFYTNTGYEYWGRAAGLIHTQGEKDVKPLANERIYHLASGQHFVERTENLKQVAPGVYRGNPLDFLVNLRALLKALADWTVDDIAPPDSRYPSFADKSLVKVDGYDLPDWLGALETPDKPHTAYLADYGHQWSQGVVTQTPPRLLAEFVPPVPAVDAWGNEIGGLRHPLLAEPLAAYLPWVKRYQGFAPKALADFRGALVPMSKDEVLERFGNWDAYRQRLEIAISVSVQNKELLPRDQDRVIEQGRWLWNRIVGEQEQ